MLYLLSEVMPELFAPSRLLLILLCGAITIFLISKSTLALRLLIICVVLFSLCAWTPVGAWLMRPLENRFPHQPIPKQVNGIIVLGGAFNLDESDSHGTIALNFRAERLTAFVELARRFPHASLVFSGGKPGLSSSTATEAQLAQKLFVGLGLGLGRITFEGISRNTHENALLSRRAVKVSPGATWLLVTSAADMPRAVGCFRAIGWRVTPVPVDFHTDSSGWSAPGLVGGLEQVDWATHEWVGLAYYWLRGWTSSLFPGPTQT
jgi:uncharacterized SAM-binding protein YcdF (DUF218 family)